MGQAAVVEDIVEIKAVVAEAVIITVPAAGAVTEVVPVVAGEAEQRPGERNKTAMHVVRMEVIV